MKQPIQPGTWHKVRTNSPEGFWYIVGIEGDTVTYRPAPAPDLAGMGDSHKISLADFKFWTEDGGKWERMKETADRIMTLENDIYDRYRVQSRPADIRYAYMVLDLARLILDEIEDPGEITSTVLDILEDNNFHMGRRAASIAADLYRRAK